MSIMSTIVLLSALLLAMSAYASGELETDAVRPAQVGAGPGEPDGTPPEAMEEGMPGDPMVSEPDVPAPLPPDAVARAQFTSEVVSREPTDSLDQLSTEHDRVFFFTEFVGLQGHSLVHRWEYGGEVMANVPFEVGGPRWRVYSSKTLAPEWIGEWTVTVLDEAGRVLARHTLEYMQPVPAPPASPAPGESGEPLTP